MVQRVAAGAGRAAAAQWFNNSCEKHRKWAHRSVVTGDDCPAALTGRLSRQKRWHSLRIAQHDARAASTAVSFGEAIVDRLAHHANRITHTGGSLRKLSPKPTE